MTEEREIVEIGRCLLQPISDCQGQLDDLQARYPGNDVSEAANQEDAAYCHLGDAMRSVLLALQSTLDEPVMQQLAPLLYQIRRVQAKLELP